MQDGIEPRGGKLNAGGLFRQPADIQNNRIYTKRWDAAAGAARFGEYIPAPPPQTAQNGTQTATDPVLTMLQKMQAQLNGISERITAAEKKEEPAE